MSYLIFILPAFIIALYAQFKVSSTYKHYAEIKSAHGYTGAEVAGMLLQRNGLGSRVRVEHIAGNLSDQYDPSTNILKLSDSVYGNNSVAAIGVAAHEVGHAIQHSQNYGPLELRHSIFPVTNFASSAAFPIMLIGLFLHMTNLVWVGIILFSLVVVFHLVTLPVEFNASRRAVVQLSEAGLISNQEAPMVKQVLGAAAFTYIAAALMAVANLLYYLSIFGGRDD